MFTELSEHPDLKIVTENVKTIASELETAMATNSQVREAMNTGMAMDFSSNQWAWDNGINRENVGYDLRDGGFSMLTLYKKNIISIKPEMKYLFPITTRIIENIKGLQYAAFTALQPGAHIRLHAHNRQHLVYHLLLRDLRTGYCEMTCATEKKLLINAGDCVLFDYSLPHETFNSSPHTRINLMLDITPS